MVIAIDGPAGAGKSTVARAAAAALGMTYLDTGAMYRAVALAALSRGLALDDAEAVGRLARTIELDLDGEKVRLDGEDVSREIRDREVSEAASRVSAHPQVREALVERQRAMISTGRYVAEGRDIATVVSPDAPLKIYLTAEEAERARRRAAQEERPVCEVMAEQSERDRRDSTRGHGALRLAEDAVELDTTGLGVSQVVERVVEIARARGLA